jgi:glutaredoxin
MIIKFYTKSCVPCKMLTKALNEIGAIYNEVDIESDIQTAIDNRVRSVPTLLHVETGARLVGFSSKEELQEWLNDTNS